jgi:hypothetical protein
MRAAKGQKKGKGKNKGQPMTSPFTQGNTTQTPWPSPDTSFAFPTPFASTTAESSAPSSGTNADLELILAVKEQYPDITKAPSRIQSAVAKADKTTAKQLTSGLQKTSYVVGNATKELHALREAKSKHRERWLKHLSDSVKCWEQQLKLYTDQQANYNGLIKKATQELNTARQTLEVLNKKAAGPEEIDLEATDPEDQKTVDAEAQAMAQQIQTVLQACAKAAVKEEVMEVSDAEDPPAGGPSKRQRSLEPFGGHAPTST